MTPAEEARFIALWSQGLSHDAMAQQLGIPPGTVKSRAHTLIHQGKIAPRRRAQVREPAKGPPSTVHPATGDRPPWTLDCPRSMISTQTSRRP